MSPRLLLRLISLLLRHINCALIFFCLLSSGQMFSAAQAAKIKVVTEYLSPFQIKNPDDSLGGYATEVVRAMFRITGDEATIQPMPWARAYKIALNQKNVLVYSIAHTDEREPLFHWVGKLKYQRFYLWGLKSSFGQHFQSIDEARGFLISVPREYNSSQFLTKYHFTNVYLPARNEQSIGMLYKGRVNLILGTELVLKQLTDKLELDFSKLGKLFEVKELNNDLSLAFNLDSDPAIVERYRQAFSQLKQSGELTSIRKKWNIRDDVVTCLWGQRCKR